MAENTPLLRDFAIRFIHAPMLSLFSGFKWTDTTQGFRAYSRKMLLDPQIAPFREVFQAYELLAYLSYRAPKLGYRCVELPTIRRYPKGEVPTKISSFKGNLSVLLLSPLRSAHPLGSGLLPAALEPHLDPTVQNLISQGQYGGCRRHTLPRRSLLLERHYASHTALISV
eukprot:gene413-515_t